MDGDTTTTALPVARVGYLGERAGASSERRRGRAWSGRGAESVPAAVAAEAVARLAAEFPDRDAAAVCATVARCRRDLREVHPEALPELLERLARQRLASAAS